MLTRKGLLYFLIVLASISAPWMRLTVQASVAPRLASVDTAANATFTTREGLAGNVVTSIAIAADGSAWVGTTEGATHIEAGRWTTFTHTHGLGDDWITAISIAPDGRVWFATASGGLSVLYPATKKFSTYNLANSAIPSNFITGLAVDSQDRVWLATLSNGAARFDVASGKWTAFHFPNDSLTTIALDSQDRPWVGTDGSGAFRWDGTGWSRVDISGVSRVTNIDTGADGAVTVTTADARFRQDGTSWARVEGDGLAERAAKALGISVGEITRVVVDSNSRIWVATRHGLTVIGPNTAALPKPVQPLPLVLVHGWTVAAEDTLEASEFRFLKVYAERDGIPVYYAQGISPLHTLFENAQILAEDIRAVRQSTGAGKVNLLAFSVGGLNTRALLESSLYQDDVNRAIILGTPEAGVELWKPVLAQEVISKPDEPSAIELSPEYARLFNATHAPRGNIPYDLLIGDARYQPLLDFIHDLPANDGLIDVASALVLDGANVRKTVNSDLHAYDPVPVPFTLTSYLYPHDTYERYIRNALRDPTNAPIGSEVQSSPAHPIPTAHVGDTNHTPVVRSTLSAGETVTRTVTLDENDAARFIAYYPGGGISFLLTSPGGTRYNQGDSLVENDVAHLQTDLANFSGYEIKHAQPGAWLLTLRRTDQSTQPVDVATYAQVDGPRRLTVSASSDNVTPGQAVTITAGLSVAAPAVQMNAHIAIPSAPPGGAWAFADIPLTDDGSGKFTGSFTPARLGYYVVFVSATAPSMARGAELLIAANPGGAHLDKSVSILVDRDDSGQLRRIMFDIGITCERAGQYAVGATLHDLNGKLAARITTPVSLSSGANRISISFEPADLAVPGPYSLDLNLMDASWAAIQIDGAQNAATVRP